MVVFFFLVKGVQFCCYLHLSTEHHFYGIVFSLLEKYYRFFKQQPVPCCGAESCCVLALSTSRPDSAPLLPTAHRRRRRGVTALRAPKSDRTFASDLSSEDPRSSGIYMSLKTDFNLIGTRVSSERQKQSLIDRQNF